MARQRGRRRLKDTSCGGRALRQDGTDDGSKRRLTEKTKEKERDERKKGDGDHPESFLSVEEEEKD